jgi:hypothetical protein
MTTGNTTGLIQITSPLPVPTPKTGNQAASCNNKGCRYWNCCYECNDFIAMLLVDKAEFLAQKQLE